MLECTKKPRYGEAVNNLWVLSFRSQRGAEGGLILDTWAMQSCGVGTLEGFDALWLRLTDWEEKAAFLGHLYKQAYQPGNLLYSITEAQLGNPCHKLFLTLGSKEVVNFPNLTHGPKQLHVFHFNIRRGVGVYFDEFGEPLAEQNPLPELAPEVRPKGNCWMYLPKKENKDDQANRPVAAAHPAVPQPVQGAGLLAG